MSVMQDHYWDHQQARWVHYVPTATVPEPRDAAEEPVAQAAEA